MQTEITTAAECWCYYYELPERNHLAMRRFTERKGAGSIPDSEIDSAEYLQFDFPDLRVHVYVDKAIEEDYYVLIESSVNNDYFVGRLDRYKGE
jgi:hypothetical protein